MQAIEAGSAALNRKDFREAMIIFDQVAQTVPDDVQSLVGMGIALSEMGCTGASIALFSYGAQLRPNIHEVWANLGASLRRAGHTQAARIALRRALEMKPDDVIALGNITGTYVNEGEPAEGIEFGKRALAQNPDEPSTRNNLALLLMELGRWSEAWPHWEHRVRMNGYRPRTYPGRRWRGETVNRLVVHGEQGLGDEVMFLAYAERVRTKVRGKPVIEVAPRLKSIAQRSFPWAEVIGSPEEFEGEADAWVPMGDLPALFNAGVPIKKSGYLKADQDRVSKWRERLGLGAVLLAHKGGTKQTHEEVRNPPRAAWQALLDTGRPVFSIQYGVNAAKQAEEIGVPWLEEAATDLEEQLAAIAACDVLVSVPQTALHFGGALGKRVLCPLTDKPAWRYGLSGDMPWYETVELVRRAPGEDWAAVVGRVAEALR